MVLSRYSASPHLMLWLQLNNAIAIRPRDFRASSNIRSRVAVVTTP